MSEERNSNVTIKMEPIESLQVKQELDVYEREPENEEIYLERFLNSEVTIVKQETIEFQDAGLRLDQTSYNTKLHKCNICKKIFETKQLLTQHKSIHTQERGHKCKMCGKTFKTY